MEANCHTRNPIQRDGTSQQQRLPKPLIPEYIGIDERTIGDLKEFVKAFAELIRFHHPEKNIDDKWEIDDSTNWTKFFDRLATTDGRTDPHFALYQVFLETFRYAQQDLNTLTERHLEYYLREVLRLNPAKPIPDQAFIVFELANHVTERLIKKGTLLKAGKDDLGKNVFYSTEDEIVINKASVADIKALLKIGKDDDVTGSFNRLYASPVADSADGQGAEIETDIKSWSTFGDTDRKQAEVGFAFASPLLFLAEGTRTVTFRISFENQPEVITDTILDKNIKTYFSGEEEWISPVTEEYQMVQEEIRAVASRRAVNFLNSAKSWEEIAGKEPQEGPVFDDPVRGYGDNRNDYDIGRTVAERILTVRNARPGGKFETLSQVKDEVSYLGQDKIDDLIYSFTNTFHETRFEGKDLIIIRTITKDQDPIVAYNEEALLEPFKTNWPVMKVLLATDQDQYLYDKLAKLKVKRATVTVDVTDVKNIVVQNDRSLLDPAKHFHPFGIVPSLGANFYIGSWEVFQKKLDHLSVNYKWHGLPETDDGFRSYYGYYQDQFDTLGDFPTNPCAFDNPQAKRSNTSFKSNLYILDQKEWSPLGSKRLFRDGYCSPLSEDNAISVTGDASLSAIDRDEELDPVEIFDTESKKGFIRLELSGVDFGHKQFQPSYTKIVLKNVDNKNDFGLPNEPYTPTIKEISLDYISSASIDYDSGFDNEIEQFFHVMPFGVAERADGSKKKKPYLVGQFVHEGELYIGLQDFDPPQNISLLFRVAEGSADPALDLYDIHWWYLADNQWKEFQTVDVVGDSTNGLITSGIVKLAVDKSSDDDNTVLPKDIHWLRATVEKNAGAIPDTIAILAQAVTVSFEDRSNDPDYLSESLAAGSIKKLAVSDAAISKLSQPYASFGGQVEEQGEDFYTRISERLRHKNRAISIWDYERLVLSKFPNAYKVKCLNHTRFEESTYSEIAPGHVTVVMISNVQNQNAIDPLRPETSVNTLKEVKEYLTTLNADPVTVHVRNPIYEGIKVDFKVRFMPGLDFGFYQKQLETEIKSFLSPWAFKSVEDIVFGGRIHKSRILNFVEEREYVDVVTCFDMWHIPDEDHPENRTKVDEAVATTSASILGSVGQFSRTGDHMITELETDDEGVVLCQCPDNEVQPPPSIASVDECPCDDDLSDLYDWDDSLIPSNEDDCELADLGECVLEDASNGTYFDGPPQNVTLKMINATYLLPMTTQREMGVRVVEILSNRVLKVEGDLSGYTNRRFEDAFRIQSNPGVYKVFGGTNADYATYITPITGAGGNWSYTDGDHTWIHTDDTDHQIQSGDFVDFFNPGVEQFQNVFLPKVDQAMVDDNATIRVQVLCTQGSHVKLRRNVEAGKDRLQGLNSSSTTETNITIEYGGGIYSLELAARKFDPTPGHNEFGWQVIAENVNYYQVCAASLFEEE